ncbi:hypothetical protein WN66_03234 [Saccharomyces cerevisiae]|nr:hypothetical protein WN66_03234 [Saccharomyces cerevisiae]
MSHLTSAPGFEISIFFEATHSNRQDSCMYLIEPLHLQGWKRGLSSVASPRQIRQVAPDGSSSLKVAVSVSSFATLCSSSLNLETLTSESTSMTFTLLVSLIQLVVLLAKRTVFEISNKELFLK